MKQSTEQCAHLDAPQHARVLLQVILFGVRCHALHIGTVHVCQRYEHNFWKEILTHMTLFFFYRTDNIPPFRQPENVRSSKI